jgi:hypothetical protein
MLFLSTIDAQACLVHLIRLQTVNFRLFLRQQTASFCLHDDQTVNGLWKIA